MSHTETSRKQTRPVTAMLAVGIKLLLVSAVVAAVVSGVNALTNDRYQANLAEEKRKAIMTIFNSETLSYEDTAVPDYGDMPVRAYKVYNGDILIGYCIEVAPSGFGGEINMMVGFEADRKIKGVSIVSLNETPGLGAKVKDSGYLSQYVGKEGALVLKQDVDAIAGATISSRAVLDGVNRATEVLNAVTGSGGDSQ